MNVGDKVKVSNNLILPPGENGCHPAIGTAGEISRIERGYHFVKFGLLIDLRGIEWIATSSRREIEVAFCKDELDEVLNDET